jgi:hypothetical protein
MVMSIVGAFVLATWITGDIRIGLLLWLVLEVIWTSGHAPRGTWR